MAGPYFEIYAREYPLILLQDFQLGDPVLVRELTGLTWPDFVEGAQQMQQAYNEAVLAGNEDAYEPDAVIMLGLIGVAFWHGNKAMSRRKVVQIIERVRRLTGGAAPDGAPSGLHLGRDEPEQFWAPWIAHFFPGIVPSSMKDI